ncbi:MAG: Nitrogen regulation protein [Caulobacteraceae bacterium]|nr:Nitrogen regulation protein [Caulobacteraceae bacterium]
MTTVSPTVLIVEDDDSLGNAIEGLLRSVSLRARLFRSVDQFLATDLPDGPCCLVLDVRLPGQSGLDLQATLNLRDRAPPIIFMTGHGDIQMSVRAIKAGAVEFLTKPFRDQDLLDAIQAALERDQAWLESHEHVVTLRNRLETLTPRERQVMALAAAGRLNKQIAAEMALSEITVKVHRGKAMRKMKANSFAELVRMADRLELSAADGA